jgi:hypothetical protein
MKLNKVAEYRLDSKIINTLRILILTQDDWFLIKKYMFLVFTAWVYLIFLKIGQKTLKNLPG